MVERGSEENGVWRFVADVQRRFLWQSDAQAGLQQALRELMRLTGSGQGWVAVEEPTETGAPSLTLAVHIHFAECPDHNHSGNGTPPQRIGAADAAAAHQVLSHGRPVCRSANTPSRTSTPVATAPDGLDASEPALLLPLVDPQGTPFGVVGLSGGIGSWDDALIRGLTPLCELCAALVVAQLREREYAGALCSLREREERYRAFVDHAADGMFLHDADAIVRDANEQACRQLGIPREELIGKHPASYDPNVTPESVERVHAELAQGRDVAFESLNRLPNGSLMPVEVRVRPFQSGGRRWAVAVVRDISERKRLEASLKRLAGFREAVIHTAAEGICACFPVPDYPFVEFTVWNERMTELTGYRLEEINRVGWYQSLYPDPCVRQAAIDRMERMREGEDLRGEEWTITRKDGRERTLSISTSSAVLDEGISAVVAVMQDVTERRNNEQFQRRRLEELNVLNRIGAVCAEAQSEDEVFSRVTPIVAERLYPDNCGFVLWNDARSHLVPHASFVTANPLTDRSPIPMGKGIIGATAASGRSRRVGSVSDSTEYWAADPATRSELCVPLRVGADVAGVINVESGRPDAFSEDDEQLVNTIADLVGNTLQRLRTTCELRRTSDLLQAIANGTTDSVFVKDQNSRYLFCNRAMEEILGRPVAELLGRTDAEWFDTEGVRIIVAQDRRVMETGLPETEEQRLVAAGVERTFLTTKAPYRDSAGQVIGVIGIAHDVTERQHSADALRRAQEQMRLILQGADVGTWTWSHETDQVHFSPEWKRQLGYTEDEISDQYSEWHDRVHPDDLDDALRRIDAAVAGRTPTYEAEFRMGHKDGSWRWILSRGFVLKDEVSQAPSMLGVHVDITERKRAEESLLNQKRVLELIARGDPLRDVLEEIVRLIEERIPGAICSVMIHELPTGRLRFGAGRRLPPEYVVAIDGVRTGPRVGSCGTAIYLGQTVVAEDIATDPLWDGFSHLALRHGLRCCWSVPIFAGGNETPGKSTRVLGAFAVYQHQPGRPDAVSLAAVEDAADLAGIAIARREAEASLRESNERFRIITELSNSFYYQAVLQPDLSVALTWTGGNFHGVTGYQPHELSGHGWMQLIPADQRDATLQLISSLRHLPPEAASEGLEISMLTRSGETRWLRSVVHTVSSVPRGEELVLYGAVLDVTGRRRAEEALAQRQVELMHASRLSSLGEMVAALSHEIAQPLSAIRNYAAAIGSLVEAAGTPSNELSKELAEYVAALKEQNQRCSEILRTLRDFGRRTSPQRAPLDLRDLLREAAHLMAMEMRRHDMRVLLELPEQPLSVSCDRVQILQVVVNLITNARDALEQQPSQRRFIALRARAESDAAVFEVEDQGDGFSPEALRRLFDQFFTTKQRGMGIGLSICQKIVQFHQGQITAGNHARGGAMVTVRLPLVTGEKV